MYLALTHEEASTTLLALQVFHSQTLSTHQKLVRTLPPGDATWADSAEELAAAHAAILKIERAIVENRDVA
jgi:hypothetical protein